MKNISENLTWRPVNFRTFATILPDAYKSGYAQSSLDRVASKLQQESTGDMNRVVQEFGLDRFKNWGMFEGDGALVAFAHDFDAVPLVDRNNPYYGTIQNAPATVVLRRKLQNYAPTAESVSVASMVPNGTGTQRIVAACYESNTGKLHRVNVSTQQEINHQGVKIAPTQPDDFIRQAGFVTARMVAETGHRHLVDIIHSDDLGTGIIGDLHDRVSHQLGLGVYSNGDYLSVQIEDARFAVPEHI